MTLPDFKVGDVVCRRHFDDSRSERRIDRVIGYDLYLDSFFSWRFFPRNIVVYRFYVDGFSDPLGVARVFRMDGESRIPELSFRTDRREREGTVADVVEFCALRYLLHFQV